MIMIKILITIMQYHFHSKNIVRDSSSSSACFLQSGLVGIHVDVIRIN